MNIENIHNCVVEPIEQGFNTIFGEGLYTLQIITPKGERTKLSVFDDQQENITSQFLEGLKGELQDGVYTPENEGDSSINIITNLIVKRVEHTKGA